MTAGAKGTRIHCLHIFQDKKMKYQSMLDQIQSGRLTRDELAEVRRKAALPKYVNDTDTAVILQAIDSAVARDTG